MKRRLEYNGYIYLPQVISANVLGRAVNRLSHNAKRISRIEETATYQNLQRNKYPSLVDANENNLLDKKKAKNLILSPLITIENTAFGFVDYDEPKKLNRVIRCDYDILAQEFMDFINPI